jgi:DNA-binding transcriptional LysR family regulator
MDLWNGADKRIYFRFFNNIFDMNGAMDINVARTFLEIVKTGSFVAAAENLYLTQTAVSARIRVLEERLDRKVFVRNKAGARLTPAGEQFLRFATSLVQTWDRARRSVALAPGRETVVIVGVELSQWSPLMRHWLLWMREHGADIAVSVHIDTSERLMEQVQEGTLDVAILYAPPPRAGVIAELLFEERLVLVRTPPFDRPLDPADWVHVDWGDEFETSFQAAFPDADPSAVTVDYGPLALDYMLAGGGAGYFRMGMVRPLLDAGRLALVADSPEFSYPSYMVHSTKADEGVMARIRRGLRAAAALST